MKTLNILLLGVFLIFIGCKKEEATQISKDHSPKFPISFKLGVTQDVQSFSANAAADTVPLGSKIKQLYYLVYNSKGEEVNRRRQEPSDEQFGTILDSLPEDTYTIVFAASDQPFFSDYEIGINTSYYPEFSDDIKYNLSTAYLELAHGLDPDVRASDIFFAKTTVKVTGEPVQANVVLKRLVGKLEVNLLDPLPANASYVRLTNVGELYRFRFKDETLFGQANYNAATVKVDSADLGKPNFKISMFILNTESPIDVTVSTVDSHGNPLIQKTIKGVRVYRNQRTILKGRLSDSSEQATAFTVNVNPVWSTDTVTTRF